MIPRGWVATGLRAPDLRVNVTLPVSTAGQDIYLFWLAGRVCEVNLTHARTYTRIHTHTTPALQTGLPPSSPSSCTVRRRQTSSGKPGVNSYCIYWSACCVLLFICPCGWNSICAHCKDVKLSLSGCYFWRHLVSQLKSVCGEVIRVN